MMEDELRAALKSTIDLCNKWRKKSEGQTKENDKQMSHAELQRRIIANKNEEITKLRGLLEEWQSWSGTPFYDNDATRVRMLELKRRTREALGK